MDPSERRRRRLTTGIAAVAASVVVGAVALVTAGAQAAGPGPVPSRVVVPKASTKAVSGPLAAAADAGDPNAIDAPGTEGSDGTTGGGDFDNSDGTPSNTDLSVDGSAPGSGTTGAPSDDNASDDPEGQFGPGDSAGTAQDPNP